MSFMGYRLSYLVGLGNLSLTWEIARLVSKFTVSGLFVALSLRIDDWALCIVGTVVSNSRRSAYCGKVTYLRVGSY